MKDVTEASQSRDMVNCDNHLNRLHSSRTYRFAGILAHWLDRYGLDGLIGFIPIVGDSASIITALPFIYISAFKVKSLPLTLAIIFNALYDSLIGMIPFWIGNILDFFNKSNAKNYRLIESYVNGDRAIINEVNSKAWLIGVLIFLLCALIWLAIWLISKLWQWLGVATDKILNII